MHQPMEAYAERVNFNRQVNIMLSRNVGNRIEYVKEMPKELASIRDDEFLAGPPSLTLDHREAQSVFDALWRAGFRPIADNVDESKTMEAMRSHLTDMRALAFGLIKLPEFQRNQFAPKSINHPEN